MLLNEGLHPTCTSGQHYLPLKKGRSPLCAICGHLPMNSPSTGFQAFYEMGKDQGSREAVHIHIHRVDEKNPAVHPATLGPGFPKLLAAEPSRSSCIQVLQK